jgi:hydrogenase expression/formation protein HypE
LGKLQSEALKDVLKCVKKTPQIIIPPMSGFDSGVHEIGEDRCVVVSTDPCIGVPKQWFGWFLIHFAASDVAVFGAHPQYGTINLLAPLGTKKAVFKKVMKQACKAADELRMTIITGHTGTYNGLSTVVGTCTAYGIIRRDELITPAGAKPEDYLICTKPLGLETLVNFTLTHKNLASELFGPKKALELARKVKMQTCVKEALLLAKTGGVTAMHDATEGGFVAALNEIADASNVGFLVDFAKLPILSELNKLAEHFKLDREQILATSSTGTLLAAVSPSHREKAIEVLSKLGLNAKTVGVFLKSKERLIKFDGEEADFPKEAEDSYAKIMAK